MLHPYRPLHLPTPHQSVHKPWFNRPPSSATHHIQTHLRHNNHKHCTTAAQLGPTQHHHPSEAAAMEQGNPVPVSSPFLCGLTGSIGMGKSTVSGFLSQHGVPVLCADDVVHSLYSAGGAAVGPVGQAFPSAVVGGAVDRAALSACVVGNEAAMQQLEGIVHPLVEEERIKFLKQHVAAGTPLVVFDIPLLYETGAEAGLDAVMVVSAPEQQQTARVMARPGMSREKLAAILARQVPDAEKRKRADYIIDTGCSLQETEQQVVALVEELKGRQGAAAERLLGRAGQ